MSEDTSLARIERLLDVALQARTEGEIDVVATVHRAIMYRASREIGMALTEIRPDDLTWLHEVAAAYAVDDAPVHLPPIERRRYVATLQEDA